MKSRETRLSEFATEDIRRRVRLLRQKRGRPFSEDWQDGFLTWLERIAKNGAVIGTALPSETSLRTFPCKKQATILAEFTDTELRIVRVYFAGQDWLG
jgi:hypothetical protein